MNTENIAAITCITCAAKFQGEEFWAFCPPCSEARDAALKEEKRLELEKDKASAIYRTRASFANETPKLFHGTDTTHEQFNAAGWVKAKDWKPSSEKPGLGLIGETGTCKSRIACLLAATEIERLTAILFDGRSRNRYPDPPSFYYVTGYELCEIAALCQTGTFTQKAEARIYLDSLRRADLVLIDDLGKGRLNDGITAELFGLIDHRYSNLLSTIWTGNSTPEQIAARMGEDAAAPFAGRLNDHCRIIRLK